MIKRRENTQIYGVPTFMCTFKLLFHETCNGGLGILCFVNYHLFPQILHSKFYSFYNFLLDKSCQVLVHLRHLYLGSQNTFHVINKGIEIMFSLLLVLLASVYWIMHEILQNTIIQIMAYVNSNLYLFWNHYIYMQVASSALLNLKNNLYLILN